MFARIRDELDAISNSKKEDKIVVTGLTNTVPMPQSIEGKRTWLREMVGGVFNNLMPGAADEILFVDLGRKNSREIPLVEVKMKSKEIAGKIRRQFAARRRAGGNFGKLFLANAVTLATRVRIDILRAMSRQCINDDETAYVNAYASRPVLTLKKKDASLRPLVLTFADAIVRFGKGLADENLQEAYRRAGNSFGGQLQQHFVVLKDEPAPGGSRGAIQGGNRADEFGNRTPAKKRQNALLRGGIEGKEAKITKK